MEDRSNNLRHENIHNLAQHKHKTWFSAKFQLLGCGINPSIRSQNFWIHIQMYTLPFSLNSWFNSTVIRSLEKAIKPLDIQRIVRTLSLYMKACQYMVKQE